MPLHGRSLPAPLRLRLTAMPCCRRLPPGTSMASIQDGPRWLTLLSAPCTGRAEALPGTKPSHAFATSKYIDKKPRHRGSLMSSRHLPQTASAPPVAAGEVLLVANGDLRQSANKVCWPAQEAMEAKLTEAFAREGARLLRAHPYDPGFQHGFIYNQR